MNTPEVKVIADSISPQGKRITTLACTYWRGIHSEVMTHRAFARNAASSRAIPFLKMIDTKSGSGFATAYGTGTTFDALVAPNCTYAKLRDDPFIPKYIGAEQSGMQTGEQLSETMKLACKHEIMAMKEEVLRRCLYLHSLGVHKSIINRYLEPWSTITTLITATEWDNFFKLRIHPAAEPHFNELAVAMKEAMDQSTPQVTRAHLPFIDTHDWNLDKEKFGLNLDKNYDSLVALLMDVSAARCARVSFLTHEGKRDISLDLKLAHKLKNPGDGVLHASPFEHPCVSKNRDRRSGPFIGWVQYRELVEKAGVAPEGGAT